MIEIHLSGEKLLSPSSVIPSSDVTDDLHVILSENGTSKLDASLWNLILNDPRLRSLSLINLQLYQSDARILAEFFSTTKLLNEFTMQSVLHHVYIFDQILNDGLQKNQSIQRVVLSNLENVDAATIASLIQRNETIEYLTLSHNHLSSNGATSIADALRRNSVLANLDLSYNNIGNDGALAFLDLLQNVSSKLVLVNFIENPIDAETRDKFHGNITGCRVIFNQETEPILIEEPNVTVRPTKKIAYISTILVTFLFFLWGIPNQLNDVLIRQFSKAFVLTRLEAGLVQSAFYVGYFAWSLPAAYVLRAWGYKIGLILGLVLFGTGCFLFWPAALIGKYTPFLAALFVIATGLAFLETAANPFIAQAAGPAESSEKRLNVAQAFNPLGAITGALVGTLFIFSGIELTDQQITHLKQNHSYEDYLKHETVRVVQPYVALGGLAYLWALLITFAPFPKHTKPNDDTKDTKKADGKTNLCQPLFLFAVVAQFAYVGAQVGTWSYFIQYAQDYVQVGEKTGGYLLTGTLVMFAIGRLTAALLMHCGLSPPMLLAIFAMVNVILSVIAVLASNTIGLTALFFTSFFMSLMFPTIFALGIKGFSTQTTKLASCFLIMSIIGGAVLTPLMGWIAVSTKQIALAYTVPGAAYLIIGIYALAAYAVKAETF